jgi:hypothetical protein
VTGRQIPTDERFSEWEELTSRESDGCAVSLLWHPATNRVKVAVAHVRRTLDFELDVDGAIALSAFHHPFAFAAAEGIAFDAADRDIVDLQPQI